MPELPEVETIKIGLENKIIGKKITEIFRSNKNLRTESALDFSLIAGEKITKIDRRARYLIIEIAKKYSLIIHLGMSGRLIYLNEKITLANYKTQKHDHFICEFESGELLIFNDPRRFGFVDLILSKNLKQHKYLIKLGPEPFDQEFDEKYLHEKLKSKTTNIKTTMMDNQIVVGVGNIYINESLFLAQISPLKKANSLTKSEIKKLVVAIKNTLKTAIESGGSSINDYVDSSGNLGNFQNNFKIYGLAKNSCVKCSQIIERIVQNGRSTFYCKKCQT